MIYSDYGIPIFYDIRNGEMILRDTKEFFEGNPLITEEVNKDQLLKIRSEVSLNKSFLCGHCKRPIYISGRHKPFDRQKRLHFKHFRYEDGEECIFHEGLHHSQEEIRRMIFNGYQESNEHKKLKQIIKDSFIHIVGEDHVFEEPTLHGNDGGWRRPDIYVELPEKSIVFEVQLTYIFLSVINERNIVHRNNGRFVLWIFKDFGNGDGKTIDSERLNKLDIFAANNFNAFVLDDDAIERTDLMGELYLTVYYRDYYNENGQTNAKLGKALVSFKDLIFDEEKKLCYYFDSERKFNDCIKEIEHAQLLIQEEDIKREQEIRKLKLKQQALENEKRRKDEERQIAAKEEQKNKIWKAYNIISRLFSPKELEDYEMDSIIEKAKYDFDFFQFTLQNIYSFTSNHRYDVNSMFAKYYQNSITLLTALYDEFSSRGKPNVMTCLKRCWENLAWIAQYPGGKDYTVEALFSPSLSTINYKLFDFIASPNHKLMPDQRIKIQEWIRDYHKSNTVGKPGKDRYRHFYSWMVILNDKVKNAGTIPLETAHNLMKGKYKVIRGIISLRFGFLTGYNDSYKSLTDVVISINNKFPEYAEICCAIIPSNKRMIHPYDLLFQIARKKPQNHDLDELMKILFTPTTN